MNKNVILWIAAIIFTLLSAGYQRRTGPTYPVSGKMKIGESEVKYSLARSHSGMSDHKVNLMVPDSSIRALLIYKRYKTKDPWTVKPMLREGNALVAYLPGQPPAGKLMYRINLRKGDDFFTIPVGAPVVIRYKGKVPPFVLIPHIILMFLAMLWSTRTGMQGIFYPESGLKNLILTTIILLFLGGMILGPIVQKYAFGAFWTGVPFGWDLTDNKTLIAMIGWLSALWAVIKQKSNARWWVVGAAVILLAIYLIPHSVMGSELDYSKLPQQ